MTDLAGLDPLLDLAATCPSVEAFRDGALLRAP
jgi:hypothetical protein